MGGGNQAGANPSTLLRISLLQPVCGYFEKDFIRGFVKYK
jgi:hypothetical protein